MTSYQSQVVRPRRRGLVHPYELIKLIERGDGWGQSSFEEYDLDAEHRLKIVASRPAGGHQCGVVFGIFRRRVTEGGGSIESPCVIRSYSQHGGFG